MGMRTRFHAVCFKHGLLRGCSRSQQEAALHLSSTTLLMIEIVFQGAAKWRIPGRQLMKTDLLDLQDLQDLLWMAVKNSPHQLPTSRESPVGLFPTVSVAFTFHVGRIHKTLHVYCIVRG